MKPIDLLTIIVGVLCLVAIKFAPGQTTLLVATGMFLIGKGLPQGLGNTKTNPSPPSTGATPAALLALMLAFGSTACHNVTPDQFLGATVDCARVNPSADAALASVETCLVGAIASNPAVCLTGLITEAHFAIDEVACLVAYVAQMNTDKVGLGIATTANLQERNAANAWLVAERISIRNSYSRLNP
jgi:hypothetical protein